MASKLLGLPGGGSLLALQLFEKKKKNKNEKTLPIMSHFMFT